MARVVAVIVAAEGGRAADEPNGIAGIIAVFAADFLAGHVAGCVAGGVDAGNRGEMGRLSGIADFAGAIAGIVIACGDVPSCEVERDGVSMRMIVPSLTTFRALADFAAR